MFSRCGILFNAMRRFLLINDAPPSLRSLRAVHAQDWCVAAELDRPDGVFSEAFGSWGRISEEEWSTLAATFERDGFPQPQSLFFHSVKW